MAAELPDPFAPPPDPPADDGAKTPARAGATPAWMTAGGAKKAPGRGAAVTVGLFLTVAVAGVLAAVLFLLEGVKDPYLVAVPVFSYDDRNLPPAAWVERDADVVAATLPKEACEVATTAQQADKLRLRLKAVRDGVIPVVGGEPVTGKDRPFVLYIAALPAVDGNTVYILPADARAGDAAARIKVEDVLDAMKGWPSDKKFLILDLSRPTAGPFAGPLADDAPRKLHDLLERTDLPCPVLTACGPDELGHAIPAEKCSAFAFYLAEGMRGAADGYNPTKERDQTVRVRELAEFVAARVSRWAEQNAAAGQHPRLYDRGHAGVDFKLVLKVAAPPVRTKDKDGNDEPLPVTSAPLPYPPDLLAAWKTRDAVPAPALAVAGGDAARLDAVLARIEAALAGSTADARGLLAAVAKYTPGVQAAAAEAARPQLAYRSLLAVPTPPPVPAPNPDPVKNVRTAAGKYFALAAPPNGVRPKDEVLDAAFAEFKQAAALAPPDVAAKVVWQDFLLAYSRPDRNAFTAANAMIKDVLAASPDLYVEAVALARIADSNVHPARRGEDGRDAHGALFAAENAQAMALLVGPDGFPWVADALTAADAAKRAGERALFDAKEGPAVAAAAVRLKQARLQFDDARKRQTAVADARAVLADAARVLGGSAYGAAEFDVPALEPDWVPLADRVRALTADIGRLPRADLTTDAIAASAAETAAAAAKVRAKYAAAKTFAAMPVDVRTRPNLVEFRGLLASPLVAADDRKGLWDKYQEILKAFHDRTRKESDGPDNESFKPTTKSTFTGARDTAAPTRRARVAGLLLAAVGVEPAGTPPDLRAAWAKTLPDALKKAAGEGDWVGATVLARVYPAGLWPDVPVGQAGPPAGVVVRRAEDATYRAWVAAHYREYGTLRKDVPTSGGRYENAAAAAGRRPGD